MARKAGFDAPRDLRERRMDEGDFPKALRGKIAAWVCRLGLGKPLYRLARAAFLNCFPVSLRKP